MKGSRVSIPFSIPLKNFTFCLSDPIHAAEVVRIVVLAVDRCHEVADHEAVVEAEVAAIEIATEDVS